MPRHQPRRQEAVAPRRGGGCRDAEAAADENGGLPKLNGCPVFDPITCQCPKTPIVDGVKMTCTSETCPYAATPLHTQCFDLLENSLVKRLGSMGSARGWTVPQRKNNLWEKKGQSLVGRYCRCLCGNGLMTRDKQAMYEKEKVAEKEKKKKAKKAKQLPQLQFNSKPAAALEETKRETANLIGTNSPSVQQAQRHSFSSRSRLYTDRSNCSMRTFTVAETMSEYSNVGESNGKYSNNAAHPMDLDSDLDDDDKRSVMTDYTGTEIKPAPIPPPLSKSFAETIKDGIRKEKISSPAPAGLPGSPDSGRHSASDHEERGDFNASKDKANPLGLSLLDDTLEVGTPPPLPAPRHTETTAFSFAGTAGTAKTPSLTDEEIENNDLSPSDLNVVESPEPMMLFEPRFNFLPSPIDVFAPRQSISWTSVGANDEKEDEEELIDNGWTPFFGSGFNFGERLMYLP